MDNFKEYTVRNVSYVSCALMINMENFTEMCVASYVILRQIDIQLESLHNELNKLIRSPRPYYKP